MKALLVLLGLFAVSFGMNTPFQSCGADPSGNGLCLSLNLDVYNRLQKLAVGEKITIANFQLETGGPIGMLSLRRFSAAEDESDLPYVVLLRGGFAFERDFDPANQGRFDLKKGSTVFLALSPHGSNGFLEVSDNSTYFLSTPWKSVDASNPAMDKYIEQLKAIAAKSFPNPGEHVSVLFEKSHMSPSAQTMKTDYIFAPQDSQVVTTDGTSSSKLRRTFRVASDVDYQMYIAKGYNVDATSSYYFTLVGSTSSIFARDFGHDLVSSYLRIFTVQDPYPWSSSAALEYMQRTWSTTTPSRSLAALVSAKNLGGGIAYYRTLCYLPYAYAVNGNMVGYFPTPLRDYDQNNWDIFVFAHELGHVYGGSHTHELNPPADYCGSSGSCGPTVGTILSYCHICSGGMGNIQLQFHTRSESEIKSFVDGLSC